MPKPIRHAAALLLLLLLASGLAAAAEPQPQRPLLLELFTSQGCSSCPPADALLGQLARRGDLLPLAFHVDYWNDLGWADTFSSPAFTARQQDYAASRGFNVYTPQLVVDGREDAVGSNAAAVEQAIAAARRQARGVPASIARSGGQAQLKLGTLAGARVTAQVYLLSFDSSQVTRIERGENAGRQLVYANVVRSLRRLGEWRNEPLERVEALRPEERGERLALLVQDGAGTVWALASTPAAR